MTYYAICQRAVESPRKKKLPVTASTQRPYSVHDALTARKKLLQRAHGAHTALIAVFYLFLYFQQNKFVNK